jgi:hypothetical protein
MPDCPSLLWTLAAITCAMCPIVTTGKARPLRHYSSDRTAVTGRLPIATKSYGPLVEPNCSSVMSCCAITGYCSSVMGCCANKKQILYLKTRTAYEQKNPRRVVLFKLFKAETTKSDYAVTMQIKLDLSYIN